MGFNLLALLDKKELTNNAKVVLLDVDLLEPHEKNRQIKDIDKLKEAIDTAGGIKQPLLVRKLDEERYRILAGHRRTAAAKMLVAEGKEEYRQLPCIVETELDEDEQEILLILLNEQQEKSDYEKIQDTIRIKELIARKKRSENLVGSVRQLTAEALGETPTQIARYESIDKHLVPELKEELREGKLGISAAYEASKLQPEEQQRVVEQKERSIKSIRSLSKSDKSEVKKEKPIRKLKEEFKDYICTELCKHIGKKEDNLLKQCAKCRVDEYLGGLKG